MRTSPRPALRVDVALALTFVVVAVAFTGCSSDDGTDGTGGGGGSGAASGDCGNGTCDASESCARCPKDCGVCVEVKCSCGDGKCDGHYCGEDCSNCPDDCGKCEACGDGVCTASEKSSASRCDADCGTRCGDGICGADETSTQCPADCDPQVPCGDGVCDPYFSETWTSCPADCDTGKNCGDGVCFSSPLGFETFDSCPADCDKGHGCGDGICHGAEQCYLQPGNTTEPGNCPADCQKPGTGGCGDGACTGSLGETCSTCPQDCGTCPTGCGDGKCDNRFCGGTFTREDCVSCPQDCGTCPVLACGDGKCSQVIGEDCSTCAQDCGTCPTCGDGKCLHGENCGTCETDCKVCPAPKCGDAVCDDGEDCTSCAVDCGECAKCGDKICASEHENATNCPADCGGPVANAYYCGDGKCDPGENASCGDCNAVKGDCEKPCDTTADCDAPWLTCSGSSSQCIPTQCSDCFGKAMACCWCKQGCSNVACAKSVAQCENLGC